MGGSDGRLDFAQFASEQLIQSTAAVLEADVDGLLLMARKVSEEIKERVSQHPDVFRKIASLDDETLKKAVEGIGGGMGQ